MKKLRKSRIPKSEKSGLESKAENSILDKPQQPNSNKLYEIKFKNESEASRAAHVLLYIGTVPFDFSNETIYLTNKSQLQALENMRAGFTYDIINDYSKNK